MQSGSNCEGGCVGGGGAVRGTRASIIKSYCIHGRLSHSVQIVNKDHPLRLLLTPATKSLTPDISQVFNTLSANTPLNF